ncbi:mechanosensitive ion channel mscs transmembrane-2 [Lucifera butyrica]|uniref:Mechanosensitive ion channel mscs transmembrane-2 n=1 Tax=Lucifera butyrica TaxID=1351585 RepID=A0A498RKW0_9FIRM|nr:mechanosensitive ion channel family protein [Lucifera butyrica]VBB09698.1 mechanosensitive ion channel mscs transmembrane-2 [Lucifera butyrica]
MQVNFFQIVPVLNQFLKYAFSYSHLYNLVVSVVILGIFVLFKNIFTNYIFKFLRRMTDKTKGMADEYLLTSFHDPLKNAIVLLGLYLAFKNYLPSSYDYVLNKVLSSGVIILFANAVYKLVGFYAENETEIGRLLNGKIDKILIPFFSKMIRFIIVALTFVVIASDWGYDVNGFVAGLGLGGLAFALAAKDLLANVFSGIVIIIDKPFSIGDWIKTNDVEGTVVDINFRSTKIRMFDQALVTVPNFNLVNASIINFTKRPTRRITFNLEVTYSTPSHKLQKGIERIEKLLLAHSNIDETSVVVKFDSFGGSALQIFVYFFTKTIVWADYLNTKQDINFGIMKIMEEEGISFAFPSTSVYLETPLKIKQEAEAN